MFECYEFEECEYNGQPKCCLPDDVDCPHGVKNHKPTNADRIRSMSDEELEAFLERVHENPCDACCGNWGQCRRNNAPEPICKNHFLEWLQQPAEEDN